MKKRILKQLERIERETEVYKKSIAELRQKIDELHGVYFLVYLDELKRIIKDMDSCKECLIRLEFELNTIKKIAIDDKELSEKIELLRIKIVKYY